MTILDLRMRLRVGGLVGFAALLLLACDNPGSSPEDEGAGGGAPGGAGSASTSTGGTENSGGGSNSSGGANPNITVTYGGQSNTNVDGYAHGGTTQIYDEPLTPPQTCDDFVSVDDQPYCDRSRLCNAQAVATVCSDDPNNVARKVDDCLYDNGPHCVSIWDPNEARVCLGSIVDAEKDDDFELYSANLVERCADQADWFFLGMNVIWAMLPAEKRDALESCVASAADCEAAYDCLKGPSVNYYGGPACVDL